MAPNAALQQSLNEAEAAARQYDASTRPAVRFWMLC